MMIVNVKLFMKNEILIKCLEFAERSKSSVKFGCLAYSPNCPYYSGVGWNRIADKSDRKWGIPHIDYCVHAEQAAIINMMENGDSPDNAVLYIAGLKKGKIIKQKDGFVCMRCCKSLKKWDIEVCTWDGSQWINQDWEQAAKTSIRQSRSYWSSESKS